MLKKILILLLFNIIFCFSFSISWSSIDKEINITDDFFNIHKEISEAIVSSEEDFFYKNYYLAKTSLRENEIINYYNNIINLKYENYEEYPNILLEIAKIYYYKKDYDLALDYTLGIKNEKFITKKTLLLAKIYLAKKDYYKSINYSQEYIKKYANPSEIEKMYFLIVEAFLENKNYDRAKNNLDYLCVTKDFPKSQNDLLLYKSAYCTKMLGETEKSNNIINKLTLEHPHSYWTNLFFKNNFLKDKEDNNFFEKQKYFLQTGVYQNEESAVKQAEKLKKLVDYPVMLEDKLVNNNPCKAVIIGYFDDEKDSSIEKIEKTLKDNNYAFCILSKKISEEENIEKGKYYLQLGIYKQQENQKNQINYWEKSNYKVFGYEKILDETTYFCVAIGPYENKENAEKEQNKLQGQNINSIIFIGN